MGDADDCNALILPVGKRKHKEKKDHTLQKLKSSCLNKKEQRKLRRLREEKEEKEKRAQVLKVLEKYKISEAASSLLYTSAKRGQKESMREKLRRAVHYKKAGLNVSSDIPLFHKRGAPRLCGEIENDFKKQIITEKQLFVKDNEVLLGAQSTDLPVYLNGLSQVGKQAHPVEESSKAAVILASPKDLSSELRKEAFEGNESDVLQASALRDKEKQKNRKAELEEGSMKMEEENFPCRDVGDSVRNVTLTDSDKEVILAVVDGRRNFVVHVMRSEDVQKAREKLPIIMMEQEIMEAISENGVTIICGETGCGKTTQVPQFLYEAGFSASDCLERSGMIGITQPRRVAVLATAKRLAHEMNLFLGQEVGFQVRHDRKVASSTQIKFMTDGILLREIQSDFLLRKYSVIVLDEAHERSLNTDILIGMLSRILPLRQKIYEQQFRAGKVSIYPMKMVIMSATLLVDEFVANKTLFACPPPVIEVPTRQFPVTVHFSAKTELVDYVDKAYKKVCAIHKKLPPGGVLVFLTGQAEIHYLCEKLQKGFPKTEGRKKLEKPLNTDDSDLQDFFNTADEVAVEDEFDSETDMVESLELREPGCDSGSESDLEFSGTEEGMPAEQSEAKGPLAWVSEDCVSLESIKVAFDSLTASKRGNGLENLPTEKQNSVQKIGPLHVLPLYALLPAASQLKIFGDVPEGSRLVVVATNVAETSITIPGIRYVVDCGRVKEKVFEQANGITKYEVRWISKASAAQRAGRSGRTGPGHCYRLYSSAIFNDVFPSFSQPEIYRAPIEGLVLTLKSMNILKVNNFPFLSAPDKANLIEAENCLHALSALDSNTGCLTPLGHSIALYPISPRHSRMLLTAVQLGCSNDTKEICLLLAYAGATVAALSLDSPFMTGRGSAEHQKLFEQEVHKLHPTHGDPEMAKNRIGAKSGQKTRGEMRNSTESERSMLRKISYRHFLSDALGVAKVLQAYETSGDPEEFCTSNNMHARILYEMSKLRKQLIRICLGFSKEKGENDILHRDRITVIDVEDAWKADGRNHDLSTKHDIVLRQAICAGWADRVARKVSIPNMLKNNGKEEKKSHKLIQYQTCTTDEIVFVHPSSSLRKWAPDFVVFNELVRTSRPYMRALTSVDASWLVTHATALCTFSKPLSDPPPWYDGVSDDVYCWVSPSFGPHDWQLPLQRRSLKSKKQRIAVFACALLQGKVIPGMQRLSPYLAADPSILVSSSGVAQKRASELLHALAAASIDSRCKLKRIWDVQGDFLLKEILLWLQKNCCSQLESVWTQMKLEAFKDAKTLWGKKRKRK